MNEFVLSDEQIDLPGRSDFTVTPEVQAARDRKRMTLLQQELQDHPGDAALRTEIGFAQARADSGEPFGSRPAQYALSDERIALPDDGFIYYGGGDEKRGALDYLKSGAHSLAAQGKETAAMAAGAMGFEDAEKWFLEGATESKKAAQDKAYTSQFAEHGWDQVKNMADPEWWKATIVEAIPSSAPFLTGAIAGAAAAPTIPHAVAGPVVKLLGAALGGGAAVALQEAGSAYYDYLKQKPGDTDGAYEYALKKSALTGVINAASVPLSILGIGGGVVKHVLTQMFVQGAMGAADTAAGNVVRQQIDPSQPLTEGLAASAAGEALFEAPAMAGAVRIGAKGTEDQTEAPPAPAQPPTEDAAPPTQPPAPPPAALGVLSATEQAPPAASQIENPIPAGAKIDIIPGAPTQFATERGLRIEGQYALADASSLIASHDVQMRQNPAYPQELQPRDRSRAASEIQVARIANNLQPEFLGESPLASQGSPIIGEDGVVESGNARTIALTRAYGSGKAENYKQWLAANAARFGLDPERVLALKSPVLVRVRSTPVDRAEFTRQANESSVAQMSAAELAKMDAERVGNLDDLVVDETGDFAGAQSRGFVRRFVGSLPVTEQGGMVTETGELSQSGYARIRNAILARAYGNSGALMRIVESMDDPTRNVSKALIRVAPMIAKTRDAIRQGALHDADLSSDVVRAVEEFARLRQQGQTVGQMLAQSQMFGSDLTQETVALLEFLEENARAPNRIAAFLDRYVAALERAGNPSQSGLFGETTPPSKQDLLAAARKGPDEQVDTGVSEGKRAAPEPAPAGAGTAAEPSQERVPGAARAGSEDHGPAGAERAAGKPAKSDATVRLKVEARRLKEKAAAKKSAAERPPTAVDQPEKTPLKEGVSVSTPVDAAAHEAATSPTNDTPQPTEGQKKAGNYRKGAARISGLDISIENPAGSNRSGTDPNGKAWSVTMKSHYGYIRGTVGRDKDHIDVFVKPGTPEDYSGPVFVIDQSKPGNGHFDEHKVMLGWTMQDAAVLAYKGNYAKGWKGLGAVTKMPMDEFKGWLESGDTTKPAADHIAGAGKKVPDAKGGAPTPDADPIADAGKPIAVASVPREAKNGAPALALEAQTPEELRSRAQTEASAAKAKEAAEHKAEEAAKAEQERQEIARRSASAEFSLDAQEAVDKQRQAEIDRKRAEDQLAGQGDIFAQPAAEPAKAAPAVSPNTIFTEDAAEAARALLRKKLSQLNTGLDPEVMQAGITLAGYHIEKGARTFAAFAKAMIADLGDAVKPYLKSLYAAIRFDPRSATFAHEMDSLEAIERADLDAIIKTDPVVERFPGESGTEIHVIRAKNGGYTVGMMDTDINQYMPTLRKFSGEGALEKATDYAKSIAKPPILKTGGTKNVADERGSTNLERDRADAETRNQVGEEGVSAGRGRLGAAGGRGVPGAQAESPAPGGERVPGPEAAASGEAGDFSPFAEVPGAETGAAGSELDLGSRDAGLDGSPVEPDGAAAVERAAQGGLGLEAKRLKQAAAQKVQVVPGDRANISESLPFLMEGQKDDVAFAETRFAKPDGYGVLFTNATGTGKTASGLGIIKRFERRGKTNILVVVPSDKIASDWVAFAKNLKLDLTQLSDTQSAGRGIVITTYANFGQNDALVRRDWDLVVTDESHYSMQAADGKATLSLDKLRALTLHPRGANDRHTSLYRKEIERRFALEKRRAANIKIMNNDDTMDQMVQSLKRENEKIDAELAPLVKLLRETLQQVRSQVDAAQGEKRPRAVFLSATPFAYEKTVDYAEGYLFDYPKVEGRDGYNAGGSFERFMMQHFGYRMRYNKLTEPGPEVNRGLMQRQFNSWLKSEKVLSGRMLDVEHDYDRKFVLTESAIGAEIDRAMQWIWDRATSKGANAEGFSALNSRLHEKFDHLTRRYLLEAIKAKEAIPIIRAHLALGRKVVVFHDFKKGGGFNPFLFNKVSENGETDEQTKLNREYNAAVEVFNAEFRKLVDSPIWSAASPINALTAEFPDALLFNGDVPPKKRRENATAFQDDDSGRNLIIGQSAAMREGVSLHDTTGKHPRVLINLGLPTQPTTSIQQEGRIYRVGQASNAMFRYLNTGTNWERWAFATTIAQRSSAAENLALGEEARALLDAFIQGFEESDTYAPGHEGEGTGGKARDRQANQALTEWDRAMTLYFAQQKKTARTKAQEGVDYFATPEPLGLKMVEWADLRDGETALEPSAGHGAIARWLPDNIARTVVEPSSELASRLKMVMMGDGVRLLQERFEDLHTNNKYHAIVMNPPFGSGGKTAVDHLAKAAQHLHDGGRIVALIPTGPAADAKFDKWFYEEAKRPVKPLVEHPTLGAIYRGDTLESNASWAPSGTVARREASGAFWVKVPNRGSETMVSEASIKAVQPTGPRTETYRPAESLYLVANIQLPQVAFERAGTRVAARVVVIEKQANKDAPPIQQVDRDYSDAEDIKAFFERIEHASVPDRAQPVSSPAAQPAAQQGAADQPEGKKYVTDAPEVEYVTRKGKTLRGVIATGLTEEQAKEFDPYTWKKDGGYFIRMAHVERPTKFSRGAKLSPDAYDAKTFADEVVRIADMETAPRKELYVGDTPEVLRALGARPLAMHMPASVVHKAVRADVRGHNVAIEDVMRLPSLIADPVMVFKSKTETDAMVVLAEAKDLSGHPVLVAIHLNTKGPGFNEINKVASLYGKDRAEEIVRWMHGLMLYYSNTKAPEWLRAVGLQLPEANTIKRLNPTVKTEEDIVKESSFSRSPESAGIGRERARAELVEAFGEKGVAALEDSGFIVWTRSDSPSLPEDMRRSMSGAEDAAYLDGRAYLFTDKLAPGTAANRLLHELGEHHGLAAMLGDKRYAELLKRVKFLREAGNRAVMDAWAHVEREYRDLTADSPEFISEVIAKVGDDARVATQTWWRELLDALRAWLAKQGLGVSNEADIRALLRASLNKVMREAGEPVFMGRESAAFAKNQGQGAPERTSPTESAAFRKWFGDWRLASLGQRMRPVRGSDQAKAVRAEIVGRPIRNEETGIVATVSGESFGKMLSESGVRLSVGPQAHMQALGNLDLLFPLATRTAAREGKKDEDVGRVAAIHHFAVPMPFDGEVLAVKILAKEFVDEKHGTRLYLVQAVEIETPASERGESVSSEEGRSPHPPAGVEGRFAQMVAAVKGEGVSKVVDAEGRPLVVYHGGQKLTAWNATGDDSQIYGAHAAAVKKIYGRSLSETEIFALDNPTFFFTDDRGVAEGYGDQGSNYEVRDSYLRMEKPLDLRTDVVGRQAVETAVAKLTGVTLDLPTSDYAAARQISQALRWSWSQIGLQVRELGYDGIILHDTDVRDRGSMTSYAVFHPEQIKSAIGNVGTFDPTNPDIRFSRAQRAEAVLARAAGRGRVDTAKDWLSRVTDSLIYNYQDRFMDLRRRQKAAGPVPKIQDASLAEELYSGRVRARTDDFHGDMRDPLLKAIHEAGLQYDQVEEYLHAKHAPSRNAAMREINPTAPELEAKKDAVSRTRDDLAQSESVQEYLAKRRQLRQTEADLEDGLADESAVAVLKSEIAELKKTPEVRNYTKAAEQLKALQSVKPFEGDNTALSGMSDAKAAEVLAKARKDGKAQALERVSAMVDAITAKARQNLLEAGLSTPEEIAAWEAKYQHYVPLHRDEAGGENPVIGQGFNIRGPESKRATGSQKAVTDILAHVVAQHEASIIRAEKVKVDRALFEFAQSHPDEAFWELDTADRQRTVDPVTGLVVSRVNPLYKQKPNVLTLKISGEEHTITFNERDPEAMRLASAMKNLSAQDLGEVTRLVGRFTRLLATMNTSANPVFVARNFLRDLQTAFVNLSDTELADLKKQVFADVPKAIRGFWQMARGDTKGQWAQYAREFRDAGGQTGWLEHYKNIGERADKLRKTLAEMGPGKWNLTKREAQAWWHLIEDANMAVENGVRLAAFVNARKAGMSEGEAASIAKNLTVNFNRRGAKGAEMNMWYMFMNASIQGTARALKAAGNKNVQKILGYVIASGFLLDLLARSLAGDDDDDGENDYDQLPEYVKDKNFVFWLGRPITIPMPYGYNFFSAIGRKMSESLFRKNYGPVQAAGHLATSFLDAFSPVGQSGSALQFVAPTIADPFVQWAENKNFAGNPLHREQLPFGPPKPEYQMGFKSTSAPAKAIAEMLNDLTGGNEVRPGVLNFNPAALDFAITSIAGGAGRTYLQMLSLPLKVVSGEEIQPREVPVVNIFLSAKPEYQIERKFYDNLRKVQTTAEEVKHYRGNPEALAKIRAKRGDELRLSLLAKHLSAELERLRKRERAMDKTPPADWRERKKAIEAKKQVLMAKFNKRYADATQ